MAIYENISMSKVFMQRPLRVLSNIWYAFISGPKTGKPFKVKFESSTLCNLKCVMCPLTSGLTRKRGVLKFENFKKIFDEIRVPYLNLTGLGEPFMNPEIFSISLMYPLLSAFASSKTFIRSISLPFLANISKQ